MFQVKGISKIAKTILVYDPVKTKEGLYNCYSSEGAKTITEKEKNDIQARPRSAKYMLIDMDRKYFKDIQKYYEDIIKNAKALKKATNGRINMWKTGRYAKTGLKYLYDLLEKRGDITIEPIQDYETRFLLNCGGAFRLAKPYEGKLYKYDSRSYYTSIYTDKHLLIPVKAGILKTIKDEEIVKKGIDKKGNEYEYIEFGVYHCTIEKPTDDNIKRLVWMNPKSYYTHYELLYIREKGLKITMIDEPNNFLNYPRNYCKTGSEIFGEYGKTLFELKEDGLTGAKNLLNNIWGMLCKPNKNVKIHNVEKDGMIELDDMDNPPVPLGGGLWKVTKLREQKFEYDLARMKPFFLAKCRLTMIKIVEPNIEHIHYSHTDSIISDIPLDLEDNGKLGDFKYEGYCENGFVKDHNTRSPNNEFILPGKLNNIKMQVKHLKEKARCTVKRGENIISKFNI